MKFASFFSLSSYLLLHSYFKDFTFIWSQGCSISPIKRARLLLLSCIKEAFFCDTEVPEDVICERFQMIHDTYYPESLQSTMYKKLLTNYKTGDKFTVFPMDPLLFRTREDAFERLVLTHFLPVVVTIRSLQLHFKSVCSPSFLILQLFRRKF